MNRKRLLSLHISLGTRREYIDKILALGAERRSSYVCLANVHMTIEGYVNRAFGQVVNGADLVLPDGMPLAKGLKWLFGIQQERVAGMDLFPELLEAAEKARQSVYFYGSTDEVLEEIRTRIQKEYPSLTVAGMHSPPFRALSDEEKQEVIDRIHDSGANLVYVALGCPKQEKWMADHKDKVNAVMLGLGGAFTVFAGMQQRAPVSFQKFGLEWLYRLAQEPGRLWKRYLYTNSYFLWLMMRETIRKQLRLKAK